ncbi:MAG TPA: alpha-L-glutamate ligase [Anaeromyxobacteraceae bacterium]|nr:alpha-L-glutamate ligase [Anaeromyxobacteraceae bacterium]
MILAVTHEEDEDAPAVLDELSRLGAEVAVVDLARFPGLGAVAFEHGGYGAGDRWLLPRAGPAVRAAEVTAVWWRRTRPHVPHPGLSPADAGFAVRQTEEAVRGFFGALDARFVNDPWRDAAACHKPRQLAAAEAAGLAVPATLVTSDPARARAFVEARRGERVVHKALHATTVDWHPTRFLEGRDLARLEAVRLAPVILQAYVPGVDVRAIAVGDRLFAAEIDATATSSPQDFREVWDDCRVAPVELPDEVAAGLRRVMASLGLAYGAFDLRRRDDGRHLFLEVNPSGLWRFVEHRTGQPISRAIAEALCGRA